MTSEYTMEGTSMNRFNKNSEKEFKLVENVIDNMINSDYKKYKRDLLLKLRVHPLSLQKPTQLPKVEVIKDKLNLHNINDSTCESEEKTADANLYPPSKAEYSNVKHDYPLVSPYFNRMFPFCYPPHVCGGSYLNATPKFRMPPQMYCNSLKKTSATNHACYKDFGTEECFIPKRCYPSSEDIWSCYPTAETINFAKKKNEIEAVPKSRKKLSIIDPVTGKNILENITERENCARSEDGDLEHATYLEPPDDPYEDYYYLDENIKKDLQASGDLNHGVPPPSLLTGDTACSDNTSSTFDDNIQNEKVNDDGLTVHETLKYVVQSTASTEKSAQDVSKDVIKSPTDKTSEKSSNSPKHLESSNAQTLVSEQVSKNLSSQETISPSENPTTSFVKCDKCSEECKESSPKEGDCIKERLKLLKDKIYSLRQEQQKMAIMQSFLRYKKYQLEESARNLDEKKIDMANFEWNLYNKAKILQEREQWLQQKSEMLYEKALKLAHKEKILNDQEDLNSSDSSLKKCFEDDHNISWGSSSSKNINKCKETNDNEFSHIKPPSKLSHISPVLNTSECKSVTSSLDQLEKNIVNIEKIHANKEIGNNFPNVKSESFQTHSTQSKSENISSEPVSYSKGRRYLHIKYWLNKRDKSGS